ncbi:MAG TPA: MlaD family protein [Polyangiaceae bacterium]|jgi:phospholipid/cholesterol/gamma-HCH transport system substrate-binding protein
MTKEKKVGIFVVVGLAILGLAIFLIGENRKFWQRKVSYTAVYSNVAGLVPGSPVAMGGVNVGTVSRVKYSEDPRDPHIYVTLDVVRSQAERIRKPVYDESGKKILRKGTVASIINKGLLGDKMIDLSLADPGTPLLEPPGPLATDEPLDLSTYVAKVDDIVARANAVLQNLQEATGAFSDPKFTQDLKGTVSSIHDITDGIAHKDGFAHRMIFDTNDANRIDGILENTQNDTAQLQGTLADLHDVTTHVRTGPGIAHAVVYDGDLSANASGSLEEVHKDLEQIRKGNGLVHSLVYGDTDSQHLMTNVNAMSDDLRVIVSGMRQGKGTLGALLVDPSVYDDLKALLGNTERNDILRALVRYTIKHDQLSAPAKQPEAKDGASP